MWLITLFLTVVTFVTTFVREKDRIWKLLFDHLFEGWCIPILSSAPSLYHLSYTARNKDRSWTSYTSMRDSRVEFTVSAKPSKNDGARGRNGKTIWIWIKVWMDWGIICGGRLSWNARWKTILIFTGEKNLIYCNRESIRYKYKINM